jgi:integrating conjugative element membrane protein (TIGR03747 family)
MKDAASTAQREQNQRQGLIVGTITLPFRLLGVLIGSLLFSIVVECVGMHCSGRTRAGATPSRCCSTSWGTCPTTSRAAWSCRSRAHGARAGGYRLRMGVRALRLLERMSQTAERARAPSHGPDGRNYYISQVYVWAESYLIAAAFTTLTFLVRLLVLVLTLPLILTAAFVGLIDGLVRRDVRRFGAGRESASSTTARKPDAAGRAAVGHLPGAADLGASAADPAAQRGLAGTGGEPDRGQLQKVPLSHQSGHPQVPIVCGLNSPDLHDQPIADHTGMARWWLRSGCAPRIAACPLFS